MRYLLLLVLLYLPIASFAQINETWFQYNPSTNTYSIDADNIHPAAFFKSFSLNSGIEIQFDDQILSPINYYANNNTQSQIVSFLEKEFSTLLTFKKDNNNQEILTLISILPKGKRQASRMISAVDPIEETIHFKTGNLPAKAKPIYLTRMDHLELKVRENLERQADYKIKKQEKREQRLTEERKVKAENDNRKLAELESLKDSDPQYYAMQKAIYFPGKTKKE
jgi:hypothetical protein